ncbi:MAG: ATP-binding cassette domain-containing protein, partial [Deltaproteobacteria bacterium]
MSVKLSVKNLKLMRSGRDILDIEEFILNRGDVLAIVGPNGAGKSSLLQILSFLIEPDTGII